MKEQYTKRFLAVAVAASLGIVAAPADAVMLNARGTGQVLIYPYYTVNHQQTLVSVINTTAHGKALKVRFREAYNGRDVANFNAYLGPYDSWVASVFDTSSDGTGGAAIATNDNSCTVPAFPLAQGSGTLHELTFSNANYSQGDYGTPTGTDSGPTSLSRTREGFFEIIEMGEIADQATGSSETLEAITPVNGKPPGCAQVQEAWASKGYWATNASIDLLPPAGGVFGAAGIVDVAQGTLYAYDATAIDGFSDAVQHSAPGDPKPNLSTAVTDSANEIATAYVPIGNAMITAQYPAATRGVDAVSAVLMADTLYNEFNVEPGLGAATDWVITFPTMRFYVDPAIVGTKVSDYLPPFEETFGGGLVNGVLQDQDPGVSCMYVAPSIFDREGAAPHNFGCGVLCPIGYAAVLCGETAIISFGNVSHSAALGSNLKVQAPLVPDTAHSYSPLPAAGEFQLGFSDTGYQELRPTLNGMVFHGVPAIGFSATNYINANVSPGVLSNYSGAYPHRATVSCVNSINPQSVCQ